MVTNRFHYSLYRLHANTGDFHYTKHLHKIKSLIGTLKCHLLSGAYAYINAHLLAGSIHFPHCTVGRNSLIKHHVPQMPQRFSPHQTPPRFTEILDDSLSIKSRTHQLGKRSSLYIISLSKSSSTQANPR